MNGLNVVMLIGNVGREPDVRQLPSGRVAANFTLATNMRWKNQAGGAETKTEWHRVVAYGPVAETVRTYLHKGKQVFVQGRLSTRNYKDKNGATAYITEVIMQGMLMLGRKGPGDAPATLGAEDRENPELADYPLDGLPA